MYRAHPPAQPRAARKLACAVWLVSQVGCFGGPALPSSPQPEPTVALASAGSTAACDDPVLPGPLTGSDVQYGLGGSLGKASMMSVCNGALGGCTSRAPLAVGANHHFYVQTHPHYPQQPKSASGFSLVSSAPDILALEEVTPGITSARETTPANGHCESGRVYWVTARMVPKQPGITTLSFTHDKDVIDRFEIHVARAARLGIRSYNTPHPERFLTQAVLGLEETGWPAFVEAFSSSGTQLVLSDEGVSWTTSAPQIVSLDSSDEMSLHAKATGVHVNLSAVKLGEARIETTLGDLETHMDVSVTDILTD